jgi:pyruvate/2-oxoacid:ferredoxin oxidoreductase beta subunit
MWFAPCKIGFKIPSDSAIQVCRTAVRTNYFPLWEMENGKFRITAPVQNPQPISDYLKLCGKISHFDEEDIAEFQKVVNDRYNMIKSMVEVTSK